eukprot:TRINITY_DN6064_c0_g1_i1.p1 TRINITY_DN6064_c0_g1~~TRINITY_DN6064_c0_g1_i1.p1  ORF type:complete len:156 (-),score=22.83 TRINITY_DN6064_c0_g1_i1:37-504(-)
MSKNQELLNFDNSIFDKVKMLTSLHNLKEPGTCNYLVLKLEGDNKVELVHYDDKGNSKYSSFVEKLPADDSRFSIVDVCFNRDTDNVTKNKLFFMTWVPDELPAKKKMLAGMWCRAIKEGLTQNAAIEISVQATDKSEAALETVLDKIKSKSTVK